MLSMHSRQLENHAVPRGCSKHGNLFLKEGNGLFQIGETVLYELWGVCTIECMEE